MLEKKDLLEILASERILMREIIREEVQRESQKMYDKLHEEIILTRIELSKRFDLFEENVNLRFSLIEKRLASLENSQDSLEKGQDSLKKDMKIIKRKVNKFPKDMEILARHFEKGRMALAQRVEKIEHHLSIS